MRVDYVSGIICILLLRLRRARSSALSGGKAAKLSWPKGLRRSGLAKGGWRILKIKRTSVGPHRDAPCAVLDKDALQLADRGVGRGSEAQGHVAAHGAVQLALDGRHAGAHTRPLLSSTSAVLVSEPFCVKIVTNYDPLLSLHATETTRKVSTLSREVDECKPLPRRPPP